MSATKQRSSAGKGVLIFFIVFMILEGLLIFGLTRVFKNKDVTPSLAGYSMYIMDSDKMGDDVPKGALVVAANGAPSIEGISKAVLAEDVPGVGTSVFWLANVSSSADRNGVVYTVFQSKDPTKLYELKTKNIVGTATSYYVTAGKIITFMTSKFGIIALLAAPLFLLVLIELIIMIVNHSRYDDEDEDDEKPVKLDDFLFGGENDKALIENSVHQGEEAAAEITERKPKAADRAKRAVKSEPVRDVNKAADEIFADKPKRAPKPAPVEEEPEPVKDVKAKAEEVKTREPAAKPGIDPSYYERASKLIDGEDAAPAAEPEPVKAAEPAPKAAEKPAEKPAEDIKLDTPKNVTAGFEDLMKLMEAESEKLRNSLNDK
ncbi:MAG: hypothetical protein IKP95_04830 [Ruminococcus sp.]|nr:hypothetical protein [Ruminococcus sp.]